MIHITKHSGLVFDTTNKDVPGVSLKFGDLSTRIQEVVLGKLGFLSSLIDRLTGRYVKFNADGQTYQVKVKHLAETLDVSQEKILQAKAEGSVEGLLKTAMEAKEYNVSFSTLEEAKLMNSEGEVEYLEYLADSLHISLKSLLEAKQEGRLQEVLEQAQDVERKTHETYEKIENLYDEVNHCFITKDDEGSIQAVMPKELEALKPVIRAAYKTLATTNKNHSETEAVIEVSPNLKILAKVTGDTIKITSLFGMPLGSGQFGAVAKRINILDGKWEKGDESVLKIPRPYPEAEEQILQEMNILECIHFDKKVLGSQKKLRVIRNVFNGDARCCHLGPEYESDLLDMIDKKKTEKSTLSEKLSMGYQITHLLASIHEIAITHGDIKPNNIFCDLSKKSDIGPQVFVADYGGAINHTKNPLSVHGGTTTQFRVLNDDKVSRLAHDSEDPTLLLEVEKKADIFSTCTTLCMLYTGEFPFEGNPSEDVFFKVKDDLIKKLKTIGLSDNFIKTILRGLDKDFTKRPDAKTLFETVRGEIRGIDFNRFKALESLSSFKKNPASQQGLYLEKKGKSVVI